MLIRSLIALLVVDLKIETEVGAVRPDFHCLVLTTCSNQILADTDVKAVDLAVMEGVDEILVFGSVCGTLKIEFHTEEL